MILPAAIVLKIFIFDELVSLRVANAAPCSFFSHVDLGWWASFFGLVLLSWMRVASSVLLLDVWNLFLCLF